MRNSFILFYAICEEVHLIENMTESICKYADQISDQRTGNEEQKTKQKVVVHSFNRIQYDKNQKDYEGKLCNQLEHLSRCGKKAGYIRSHRQWRFFKRARIARGTGIEFPFFALFTVHLTLSFFEYLSVLRYDYSKKR